MELMVVMLPLFIMVLPARADIGKSTKISDLEIIKCIQRARKRFANLAKQDPGRAGQNS